MDPGDQCRVRGRSAKKGARIVPVLSVIVTDERGRPVPAGGLARWLTLVAPVRARGVVGIALVSDARVRALNRTYRNQDYATDVLSFPAADSLSASLASQADARRRGSRMSRASRPRSRTARTNTVASAGVCLGDIVIARGVARKQAQAEGHDEPTELRVLALHGLLHLLGYDHEHDHGVMARVERRLRRKGGLPNGLLDRAASPRVDVGPSTGSALQSFEPPNHRHAQGPVRRRRPALR